MSQQTQDRRWEVNLEADEFGQPDDRQFEQDVEAETLKVAAVLLRLGGAIQAYAVRQQDPQSGLWFPMKVVFKWQSFVPGVRAQRPTPQPTQAVEQAPAEEGAVESVAADWEAIGEGVPGIEPTEEPDGVVMVGPGGERRSVPAGEMQDYLRDNWRPLADIEDEDEGGSA